MEAKIMTQHPQGKKGVNISEVKYQQMRNAIVQSLREHGPLTFRQLNQAVEQKLQDNFEGSIGWYYTTVKLDLEARQVIECVRRSGRAQEVHLQETH